MVKKEIRNVLIVCTRRIGDVLLATPMIRSLKAGLPHLAIDMLVFDGTQDIVTANPDLRRVWTIGERPRMGQYFQLIRSIWRQYDLALSVLAGDRPTLYAWMAGRYRIGTLLADNKSRWKQRLLHEWVPFDNLHTHTVVMNLRLLASLELEPLGTPVIAWRQEDEESAQRMCHGLRSHRSYAVLHVSPKFVYKTWTVAGWIALGQWLREQGYVVVVTGGASDQQTYCDQVVQGLPDAINLVGQAPLPALGYLLNHAALYVGTDTAVSHMAAALGTPSVVLYGPSNPVKWGPWPKDFPATPHSPWSTKGTQRQGNVLLLQGEGDCVPCLAEGCERHINSLSECLQQLSAQRVIQAAETMLARRPLTLVTPNCV